MVKENHSPIYRNLNIRCTGTRSTRDPIQGTSCFVIEHRVPVILLGLVQMALGLCMILMVCLSFAPYLMHGNCPDCGGETFLFFINIPLLPLFFFYSTSSAYPPFIVAIFFGILFNLPNLYVGACLFMIGWQGGKEASQCSPQLRLD